MKPLSSGWYLHIIVSYSNFATIDVAGETLGCTAPLLPKGQYDVLIFIADGRFHLEAAMIQIPI